MSAPTAALKTTWTIFEPRSCWNMGVCWRRPRWSAFHTPTTPAFEIKWNYGSVYLALSIDCTKIYLQICLLVFIFVGTICSKSSHFPAFSLNEGEDNLSNRRAAKLTSSDVISLEPLLFQRIVVIAHLWNLGGSWISFPFSLHTNSSPFFHPEIRTFLLGCHAKHDTKSSFSTLVLPTGSPWS